MKSLYTLVLTLLMLVNFTLAKDGIKLTIETKDVTSGKTENAVVYLNENQVSMDNKGYRVIYDSNAESLTTIDTNKKEYTVITKPELKAFTDQMKQMMNLMKGQPQNLPAEQRQMFEKFMGEDKNEPVLSFQSLKKEKVNGWDTEKYSALENGKEIGHFNLASYSALKTSEKYFTPMKSLIEFFQDSFADFAGTLQMNNAMGFVNFTNEESPLFKEGLPVKMSYIENEKVAAVSEIKTLEHMGDVSSAFDIPGGYSKRSLEEMMQGSLMGR